MNNWKVVSFDGFNTNTWIGLAYDCNSAAMSSGFMLGQIVLVKLDFDVQG